jgi:hypothetical protein
MTDQMRHAMISITSGLLMLVMPIALHAKETETLDFSEGKINAEWRGVGPITIERRADGILLQTGEGTGMLLTSSALSFLPHAAEIEAIVPESVAVKFIWSHVSDPEERTAYIQFTLRRNGTHDPVLLSRSNNWTKGQKEMGLLIDPHSVVFIKKIHFTKWSLFEQIKSGIRSWMQFDTLRPYSINFVWGPQIGWNPMEVNVMYDNVPPISTSAFWMFSLGLTVICIIVLIGNVTKAHFLRRMVNTRVLLVAIGACWMVLDLYMGAQFLSWVRTDFATYISQPPETRTFRDRSNFYDFAMKAKELVSDRETYIFMSEVPWPYLGNMRYITYPSIPAFRVGTDDTWVIFERVEMDVSPAGELTFNGDPVTHPGTVLSRPSTHTMVFRGAPLPVQPAQ